MSSRSEILSIIVEWIQRGRDVPEKIKYSLDGINQQTGKLSTGWSLVDTKLSDLWKKQGKQLPWYQKFEKSLGRAGWRLGWLGYRFVMMGRLIVRWMLKPLQDALKVLIDWESSVETVAMAMGYMAAFGSEAGVSMEFLQDVLEGLLEVGPKLQASWLGLQSALIGFAIEIAEPATAVLDAFARFIEDKVIPAVVKFKPEIDAISAKIVTFLDNLDPKVVENFLQGLVAGIGGFVDLLEALKPLLEPISYLAGLLMPFAPILLVIGSALFILNPLLAAGQLLWKGIAWLIPQVGSAMTFLAAHPIVALVIGIGLIVAGLIHLWNTNEDFRNAVIGIWNAIQDAVTGAINAAQDAFKGFTDALWNAGKAVTDFIGGMCIPHTMADIAEKTTVATDAMKDFNATLAKSTGGVGGFVGAASPAGVGATAPTTISISLDIGNITGIGDLDKITEAVSRGIAESYIRRYGRR